jgi:hypothetical protein
MDVIPASRWRFTQISILRQLSHTNIISILGCVESQGLAKPCKKILDKFGQARHLPAIVLGMANCDVLILFVFAVQFATVHCSSRFFKPKPLFFQNLLTKET